VTPIRILIADDHDVVRTGVRRALTADVGWEVCGEAKDGRRALALAVVLRPDVVVLDIGMPGLNGIDLTSQLRRMLPLRTRSTSPARSRRRFNRRSAGGA
jgi:DNA-binding NarL/FixJ family response regulator